MFPEICGTFIKKCGCVSVRYLYLQIERPAIREYSSGTQKHEKGNIDYDTFFWPFYGGYNIISLDKENYSYAMVCGPTRAYLWILARKKSLDKLVIDNLIEIADKSGFKTDKLIFVKQN